MFEKTKEMCQRFLDMGVPGFDLMVCHKGECILRHIGGYSDLENKIPVKGDEIYNLFSCSKPITATAAMQLWEKGLFKLEDKLSDYFPEYENMLVATPDGVVPATRPILIRDLFQMTAGFSYNLHSPKLEQLRIDTNGKCPTREVARALAGEPLCFEPGDQYLYSLCHDVLAALVEHIANEPFEQYVKTNIFDPLGMKNSDFLPDYESCLKIAPLYKNDVESGEIKLLPQGTTPVYRLGSEHASGGAGCVSTVEDYMKFLEALRNGEKLLKRTTIDLMLSTCLTEHQSRTFPQPDYNYGLGMRIAREGWLKDFGWGGAAGAILAVDPVRELTLFYAQHLLSPPNSTLRLNLYTCILEDFTGETAPQNKTYDLGDVPVQ